jgi:hypothetical protein
LFADGVGGVGAAFSGFFDGGQVFSWVGEGVYYVFCTGFFKVRPRVVFEVAEEGFDVDAPCVFANLKEIVIKIVIFGGVSF